MFLNGEETVVAARFAVLEYGATNRLGVEAFAVGYDRHPVTSINWLVLFDVWSIFRFRFYFLYPLEKDFKLFHIDSAWVRRHLRVSYNVIGLEWNWDNSYWSIQSGRWLEAGPSPGQGFQGSYNRFSLGCLSFPLFLFWFPWILGSDVLKRCSYDSRLSVPWISASYVFMCILCGVYMFCSIWFYMVLYACV